MMQAIHRNTQAISQYCSQRLLGHWFAWRSSAMPREKNSFQLAESHFQGCQVVKAWQCWTAQNLNQISSSAVLSLTQNQLSILKTSSRSAWTTWRDMAAA